MLDQKQLLTQHIEDTTTAAIKHLESTSNDIRQQFNANMGTSQEFLIDGIHEDIEIAKEGGKMELQTQFRK
jgi:glutamine synthetase type III